MTALPTGTVTFLFTDIEGSTRLLQKLGDRYAEVLATSPAATRGRASAFGRRRLPRSFDSTMTARLVTTHIHCRIWFHECEPGGANWRASCSRRGWSLLKRR